MVIWSQVMARVESQCQTNSYLFSVHTENYLHLNLIVATIKSMLTVVETPIFQKQVAGVWTEEERLDFFAFLAANPEAGDVIPGTGGARKVRWTVAGKGKRGGVRVVYFNVTEQQIVLVVAVYAKADKTNILPKEIKR